MCTDPSKVTQRGFTLLEVILGVTVMAFLAGTMFSIIQGSLRAASEIEIIQRDNRRIERFVEVLRKTFNTLPNNARLRLELLESNPILQEIHLSGAPEAFAWGAEPVSRHPLTLSMRRYPEAITSPDQPEFFIGLHRADFFQQEGKTDQPVTNPTVITLGGRSTSIVPDEKGRYWLPILPSMKSMTWRFYDAGKKRWFDKMGASRPPLVELTMVPYERNVPIRVVFAIR